MNRQKSSKQSSKSPSSALSPDSDQELQRIPPERRVIERREAYEGPVPPPDILERFDQLVPGTARRMFDLAEQESTHRRKMEERTNDANINAQQAALVIEGRKTDAIARSDLLGQVAGVIVALSCIGGAIWCGISGRENVAIALTVVPSAAVIQAFFARRSSIRKTPKE